MTQNGFFLCLRGLQSPLLPCNLPTFVHQTRVRKTYFIKFRKSPLLPKFNAKILASFCRVISWMVRNLAVLALFIGMFRFNNIPVFFQVVEFLSQHKRRREDVFYAATHIFLNTLFFRAFTSFLFFS